MVTSTKISFNLGLTASPEVTDPRLFAEFVKLYNAINIVAQSVDDYTDNGTLQTIIASKYDASNPAHYIDAAGAPVQSVAGKVGAVTLTITDVSTVTGTGNVVRDTSPTINTATVNTPTITNPTFLSGNVNNTAGPVTVPIADKAYYEIVITANQGGIGSSAWTLDMIKHGGVLTLGTPVKVIQTADPIASITVVSNNLNIACLAANTYIVFAVTKKVVFGQ